MSESADQSHLDLKYFIDQHKYNCPFCNRRHVSYHVSGKFAFDWTNEKNCYAYFAECDSCHRQSMHLSYENIGTQNLGHSNYYRFESKDIDSKVFYSVPTSFFVLDNRI